MAKKVKRKSNSCTVLHEMSKNLLTSSFEHTEGLLKDLRLISNMSELELKKESVVYYLEAYQLRLVLSTYINYNK